MPFEGKVDLQLKCKHCGAITYVAVNKLDYNKWYWKGTGVNEFFPYLSPNVKHWMITGECWNCRKEAQG